MSRARSLSRLANANAFTVDANNRVGIGSTTPVQKLNVVGVVSATSFAGDGSALTGVAGGKFVSNSTGINTTSSVGIGTTNATGAADSNNTSVLNVGVVTANFFYGALSGNATSASTATTATNLANAANITTGTIADGRFPATLPAVSGENLTNLPASGDSNDITACLFI